MVDVAVRSPTGQAWLTFVVGFIGAGELLYEVQKEEPASFFRVPFTDAELIPWIVAWALASLFGLAWLIHLYARPGRLRLDPGSGSITRIRYRRFRRQVIEAPASEWRVRLTFFSADHRRRGVFKRLELVGPGLDEVHLFTDFAAGEGLVEGLEAMASQLVALEVGVEGEGEAEGKDGR